MGSPAEQAIAEAMNRLWAQYLPQIEERVQTLEAAAVALKDGTLTSAEREDATAAAHKLAGVLGTFGLPEGTALAREMEEFYCNGVQLSAGAEGRPAEVASLLRAVVATRK